MLFFMVRERRVAESQVKWLLLRSKIIHRDETGGGVVGRG